MIPLSNGTDIRAAEQAAIDGGRSEAELMLAAGTGIADAICRDLYTPPGRVLVLCGPGKNGGDGIVIADRLSAASSHVSVWTWKRKGVGNAPVEADAKERINWLSSEDELFTAAADADIIIDAIFGAGGRAELPDDVATVFQRIESMARSTGAAIWAVDLPSGIDVDSGEAAEAALHADTTAMIGLPKAGAYKMPAARYTGHIEQIDIGLLHPSPEDATEMLVTIEDARAALPDRRAGLHKRLAGTLLVVGGAPNYYGAPRLSGEAGLRSGAGLVSLAVPSSIIGPIASAVPELTFVPLPLAEHGTAGARMAAIVRKELTRADALVIGPGLGTEPPVPDFLSNLLGITTENRRTIGFGHQADSEEMEPFTGTGVLDADALNWLSTQPGWEKHLSGAELILTPHPGELARLLGEERETIEADPWEHARKAARQFGQVVLLKFAHSVVAMPDGTLRVAPQAPPSLATAGTGDVLAGIAGSLLAQGLSTEHAAATAMIIGLRAVELAELDLGPVGIIASDIVQRLPEAIAEISGFKR